MDYPKPISDVEALPKNYEGLARERFWQQYWDKSGVYRFEPYVAGEDGTLRLRTREEIFSIDTPPPTVSGALHIGHVYSYTQTDMNARYRRMSGKHVFYPFGFDDNGLPTERLVEKVKDVRAHGVSREEFIRMCQEVVAPAEQQFIDLWKSLALSCDWEQFYTTINDQSRAISQASFIDLYRKGYIYRKVAPTQWDWVNQTAIAQAEIEDREVPGHFHDIRFGWTGESGRSAEGELVIATTRPELIPACVAVLAHPDDERYKGLFGKLAITPLFGVEVPILPSEKADPEKGTGILMCCTFGDMDDVEHWQKFNLPTRVIINKDGRIDDFSGRYTAAQNAAALHSAPLSSSTQAQLTTEWPAQNPAAAEEIAAKLTGLKVKQAREAIRELLKESGDLIGIKDITHTVRHAERGDVPVEILVTPQWYVNILEHKEELIEQGRRITWHPAYMLKRYEQWVDGLNSDWCISRQRYNGVPFPVWYDGEGAPILPILEELPVNPLTQSAPGGWSGSALTPDPDVMDTWATSSVTPLLNTHFIFEHSSEDILARHNQLFPYDMRPQAHDIIRTWAFYTIAKSFYHFGELPWSDIVISGHAQDAARQKISKSKGHVVTPAEMVEKYSADGLRYWSGSVKLGTDTIYDETKLGEGRKLINKIFNATKFALRHLLDFDPRAHDLAETITYPTDRWLIARLNETIARATKGNEEFEFGDAKQAVEDFFWADLCDNYLELSKGRLYGEPLAVEPHQQDSRHWLSSEDSAQRRAHSPEVLRLSAQATLYIALSSVLRMFAPILPHITEECWSWYFAQFSELASIHEEQWPTAVTGVADGADTLSAELLLATVAAVRKWKSEQNVSVKKPLAKLTMYRTAHAPRDAAGEHTIEARHLHCILGDLLSTCNSAEAQLDGAEPPAEAVMAERGSIAVICELGEEA